MDYQGLMRRKLLEDIYEKMSDEEKRTFIHMAMQNKSRDEILSALQKQSEDLQAIRRNQNWAVDFGSDIAANFLTDGLIYLGSKLFKKL